jgi:hypothetical protein
MANNFLFFNRSSTFTFPASGESSRLVQLSDIVELVGMSSTDRETLEQIMIAHQIYSTNGDLASNAELELISDKV